MCMKSTAQAFSSCIHLKTGKTESKSLFKEEPSVRFMQKILLSVLLCAILCPAASAKDSVASLADAIAAEMGGEPYIVRVLYGEMLLNRLDRPEFGNTLAEVSDARIRAGRAEESDYRAAAAALRRFGFAGGALYVARWKR